jgi:zinc protease
MRCERCSSASRAQSARAPAPYRARALGAAARPEFVREEAGVRVYRSPFGVPILVRRKPGAPLVHFGVYGAGGSCDEAPSLGGLTTLTVRSALKKTSTRSALQIAEEGEMLGGSVTGLAAPESFGWTISVPARHASSAVELLSDVVQRPTFDEDVLETERAIAIADVVAARDDMYRYPMRLAIQAAFAGHSYGMPSSGTEETLRGITRDQVREWHASEALLSASMIAIVGDAEPDELAAMAARGFTELRHREPRALATPSWPRAVTIAAEPRDRAQTALVVLFPSPTRNDPDRFSADMIATVASGLGGRFFDELRDKRSLCYTVAAFANDRRLAGSFASYIARRRSRKRPRETDFSRSSAGCARNPSPARS